MAEELWQLWYHPQPRGTRLQPPLPSRLTRIKARTKIIKAPKSPALPPTGAFPGNILIYCQLLRGD